MIGKLSFVGIFLLSCVMAAAAEQPSPYVGQQTREIKSLSAEEVRGYLAGEGMALARAAELNHYPGPRHVLDMADKLQLSERQRSRTEAIFNKMRAEAQALGKALVEKERLLDSQFASERISETELNGLIAEIAAIQGKLRATHLQAHLVERELLSSDQIELYDALR